MLIAESSGQLDVLVLLCVNFTIEALLYSN